MTRCAFSVAGLAAWLGLPLGPAAAAPAGPAPARLPPIAAAPGDLFEDVTQRAGVDFTHQFCHDRIANILLSNGAGGAVFDFDNDGFVDIYLVNWGALPGVTAARQPCPREPNRLFRNRGDGAFEDVTHRAGVAGDGFASAAATGDFDNDGFTDLYVVNFGRNQLFRNRGDGTFADVTTPAGVGDTGTGISAVWFDADNDGRLDLFVANYLTFDPATVSEQNPGAYPGPLAYPGEANLLYRNRGDGTFEDVTRAAGLHAPGHRAMSVSALDADGDGDTDLYVSNDDTPNALWLNDGTGRFRDVALEAGVAFNSIGEAPGSMNAAPGDFDSDGRLDLFVTRLGYGSLYLQTGPLRFEDRMFASGLGRLTQPYVGWGGVSLDFDNDGDRDLFVTNGDAFTLPGTLSLLLENDGRARFTDAAARGGAFFGTPLNGRGAATLDFDNDGRLDLLITTLANRAILLRNRSPGDHAWLTLDLRGRRGNRNAYGASITARAAGRSWVAEAHCPTGFLLQSDPRVHLGLGSARGVEELEIRWPGGQVQRLRNVTVNRVLKVEEPL
jgi:hypothetical protein